MDGSYTVLCSIYFTTISRTTWESTQPHFTLQDELSEISAMLYYPYMMAFADRLDKIVHDHEDEAPREWEEE